MSEPKEFAVQLSGRMCRVIGHLVDSTPVDAFEAEFRLARTYDLSQLYSVSWIGLSNLLALLERIGARGGLARVPAHVHRVLVLMHEFRGTLVVESVEIEARDPKGGAVRAHVVEMDELVNHGLLRGSFVSLEETGLILDSLHVLCRPVFRRATLPRPNFARNWCLTAPAEALFWYDYCFFVRSSIESSGLILGSAVRLVEDALQSIFSRVSAAEAFAKAIHPDARLHARSRVLLELLARLNDLGHASVRQFTEAKDPFRGICHTLVGLFVARPTTRADVLGVVGHLVPALLGLGPLAASLDLVGTETSQGLFEFQERETLVGFLRSLPEEAVDPDRIASARRKARLPPREDEKNVSWRSTLTEVEHMLSGVDVDLERALVALQCYDSIRQVLEHRLAEAGVLEARLPLLSAAERESDDVRAELLALASARLATDQEKFAFEFFFPEEYAVRRNMLSGEVTFFESARVESGEDPAHRVSALAREVIEEAS